MKATYWCLFNQVPFWVKVTEGPTNVWFKSSLMDDEWIDLANAVHISNMREKKGLSREEEMKQVHNFFTLLEKCKDQDEQDQFLHDEVKEMATAMKYEFKRFNRLITDD